jgi:hypothetical protein
MHNLNIYLRKFTLLLLFFQEAIKRLSESTNLNTTDVPVLKLEYKSCCESLQKATVKFATLEQQRHKNEDRLCSSDHGGHSCIWQVCFFSV